MKHEKKKNVLLLATKLIEKIPNIIIKHPKASHKLSKFIRQSEKVSQVSGADKNFDTPLYNEIKNVKFFWMKKNQKIAEQSHVYKG